MATYNDNAIDLLLSEITPKEQARTTARMLLAAKIADAMAAKSWKKKDLMLALGKKNQSEITRWLSGTHNFTSDLLSDLQDVLGIKLLNTGNEVEKTTEKVIQQVNLTLVVPMNPFAKAASSSFACEPDNEQTYYSKTYYA
jgi:hypothetical protein